MEKIDNNEFGTWFAFDGFSALIKSILFRSSALLLLQRNEVLIALISSYYALFHFGIFLVYFNPERSTTNHHFLLKLKNDRENGIDPLKEITHKKLILILKEIGFEALSEKLSYGKTIREFYNYGPRVTLDENGEVYFGNPIKTQEKDKIFPADCKIFIKSIDRIICDEFKSHLQNTSDFQHYVLLGLWNQVDTYLNDEVLHLKNLYSEQTRTSAKKFLLKLEKQLNVFKQNLKS